MFSISFDDIKDTILEDTNTLLITLTNYGYLLYTLNMLKSLKKFNLDKKIFVICVDEKSHKIMKGLGYNSYCLNDKLQSFYEWNKEGYDKVTYYKVLMIYKLLSININLVLIDGDIVFIKNPINDIKKWNILPYDVCIQNDSDTNSNKTNLCTGYMFIRSTPLMISLYECESDEGYKKYLKGALIHNDQSFFNDYVKPHCNVFTLNLDYYPNGAYYYKYYKEIDNDVILVHFNWILGHQKMVKMKEHNMWLLSEDEEEIV